MKFWSSPPLRTCSSEPAAGRCPASTGYSISPARDRNQRTVGSRVAGWRRAVCLVAVGIGTLAGGGECILDTAVRSAHALGSFLSLPLAGSPQCSRSGTLAAAERRTAWSTSRVAGTPQAPEPYRIEPAFPALAFQKPTSVEELPGGQRMLVTEMSGKVYTFAKDRKVAGAEVVLDLAKRLPADLAGRNVSLFDAEPHPAFAENGHVFVCYVHPGNGGHTRVSRFTLDRQAPHQAVADSERVIITWPSGGHNAGCLEFNRDGYLYISTGDGSGPNPPDGLTTGQTVDDLLGAVLRLDVDRGTVEQPYAIPSDNPFVDRPGARPEIWSYGLRNPWKFGVDPQSGDVFVADNGWESWEMIHKLSRGSNCGWPVMEGRAALRSEVPVGPTPIVPPVKDHPHTEANSVIGGPVYRGAKLPKLNGSFVYGDYITGTIWEIHADQDKSYSYTTLLDTDLRIVGFTQTTAGELFVLDYDFTGQIYELLPQDREDLSAKFPRRLSDTGLFQSVERLEPAPGVVPYAVKSERWTDGAEAQRWIAIPGSGQVKLATQVGAASEFPEGTVLVKQLTLPAAAGRPAVRLETQLLHLDHGVWRPYSYLWDESGRDATLVDAAGASRPLKVEGAALDRTWHVNAVNECKLCHNAGPKFVLGFTLAQLDRPIASGAAIAGGTAAVEGRTAAVAGRTAAGTGAGAAAGASSQLDLLAAQGVIAERPVVAANDPSILVDPHDASQPLESRARSYLHANCAMCHHPGGNAIVSFYLRRDLPFAQLNTNKGTGIGTFGMKDAKLIVPGDPYRSVLMYRMSKLGYARMPYIGSRMVDSRGVRLVETWIRSLAPAANAALSAPATPGSPLAKHLESLAAVAATDGSEPVIRDAVQSTEGALALTGLMHAGRLDAGEFAAAVAAGSAAPGDVRGLFETFVPESQRRATLGPSFDPQTVLARTGNLDRGKLIFFSDGARCRNCHELDDRAKSLGPTLREIAKKYPDPAEMMRHVAQPSLKIDDAFAAYTAVTDDGRVLQGLIAEQSDREVVLKTLERQVIRLPRASIEELRRGDKSLMPDRVLSDLTAQEAADLLVYIRSLADSSSK
jgi:putative heme-binding domain-containing protein